MSAWSRESGVEAPTYGAARDLGCGEGRGWSPFGDWKSPLRRASDWVFGGVSAWIRESGVEAPTYAGARSVLWRSERVNGLGALAPSATGGTVSQFTDYVLRITD